ncbi:hypothetical protein [uncultured Dysosmobacter sp.]|uniref:hypothetical protein n=1 Tax=uncultured Dysosmobacter sp. TaxID=2591384 RepID=UPI002637474A|nr:hypothetical protein [uncultured Dysosmobacter sp.]
MTREELFRAVGQIREDQAEEAEKTKKQPFRWRRYGALAACLAVVLAAGLAMNRLRPAGMIDEGTGLIEDSRLDGSHYSTPESTPEDAEARPIRSTGVKWSELAVEGADPQAAANKAPAQNRSSACLAWLEPEEILAMDTAVFRGTVRNLRCFEVMAGKEAAYYTVASVEVTDCIRGQLGTGDIYNVLYPGVLGLSGSSVSGDLEKLQEGSDAVFMPRWAGQEAGWSAGDGFFAYGDLAELYFEEGIRFLFLDTGKGLSFERTVYADIADAATLDEVMDYLRENVPNGDEPPETEAELREAAGEDAQPAWTPVEPQPSVTEDALENGSKGGPAGARELPGGAFVSGERDG